MIAKSQLSVPGKMAAVKILGLAPLRLHAVQLLSYCERCLHISGPSRAGAGLQPGVMAGPDSERPGLGVVRNQERQPATIRPKLFPSQNPEGPPHFKAPQQVHRLGSILAQASHDVAAPQLSWFPGFCHLSIVGRPGRSRSLSAAGPPIFESISIFAGRVQSSPICGPRSSSPTPCPLLKLPGNAGPGLSVRSLLNSPAQLGLVRSYYPGSLIGMFAWGRAGGQSSACPVSLAS